MGWYVRKSFRMGPVRWNLSKSGIGVSVGVRGLRLGTGPRGAYIAGGRGGLYFRQPLGRGRPAVPRPQRSAVYPPQFSPPLAPPPPSPPVGALVEYLPQTQLGAYSPATADALARYITAQRAHKPLFWWMVGALSSVYLLLLIAVAVAAIVNTYLLIALGVLALLAIPACVYGVYAAKQWDRKRLHILLNYELDPAEQVNYQQLCAGLQALATSARLVRVDARQVHGDWKRNAGATMAVQVSHAAVLPPGSLPWLETNVPVWSLRWHQGHVALIFLPDRILVEQGGVTAAVPYPLMQVTLAFNRFVEEGFVPPDVRILAYTWKYTNKDGSPDRRFKDNRQLPVTEAGFIGFQSVSGVNLVLQASSTHAANAFVQSIQSFRPLVCAEPPAVA